MVPEETYFALLPHEYGGLLPVHPLIYEELPHVLAPPLAVMPSIEPRVRQIILHVDAEPRRRAV